MIKAILSDFSRVVLFTQDAHEGASHKALYEKISQKPDYNVFDYFTVNTALLDFYKSLHLPAYIFTSGLVQEDPQFQPHLKPIFSKIFSGKIMGLKKDNPESYKRILRQINIKPEEAIYTDDKIENIEAAKQAGLHAFRYANNEDLFAKIKEIVLATK